MPTSTTSTPRRNAPTPDSACRLVYVPRGPWAGRYGVRYHKDNAVLMPDGDNPLEYASNLSVDGMVFLSGDIDLLNLAKALHASMPTSTT